MKKVTEYCPHCEEEVELDAIQFVFQRCPNCGKKIKACCLCDPDTVDCSKCPKR